MAGAAPSVGIIPKASLTVGRAIYKPFAFPKKLFASGENIGKAGEAVAGGLLGGFAGAMQILQPRRGLDKLVIPIIQKGGESLQKSAAIRERNMKVFYGPVGDGLEGVGRGLAGPFAYHYLKATGSQDPGNPTAIQGILSMRFRDFPPGAAIDQALAGAAQQQQQAAPPEGQQAA